MSFLLLTAWGASLLFGVEAVFEKFISRHLVRNPWLFNFIFQTFISVGIIITALSFGAGIPTHWQNIFWASIFSALGGALYIYAIYLLDVSVFIPLFSFKTVFAVILGTLFLGETLFFKQYILISLIFVFGLFVSLDENFKLKSFFNRKIMIALLDTLCLAIMALFIKQAIAETSFWDATLWITVLGQIWFMFTIPLFKKDFSQLRIKQYSWIILPAIFGIFGSLLANAAYAKSISIASAIISLPISMVIAFLFSYFAPELLEKHTLKIYLIRFISTTVMIIAALNL